jgi:hypothetical protein
VRFIFCAVRLLENAKGKDVSSPTILSLGTPSLLAFGQALEMLLMLAQVVLVLPGLCSALIEQRES